MAQVSEDSADAEPVIRKVTQESGVTYKLADLLEAWGVSKTLNQCVSDKWECELIPIAENDDDVRTHLINAVPFLVDSSHAKDVFDAVGEDGLDFLQQDDKNHFSTPKIAMVGGWGRPGMHVLSNSHLRLVNSFSEVLVPDGPPLNLQMFHRGEDLVRLGALPGGLHWPAEALFEAGEKSDLGVRLDMATRVSQRNALTWWHLDDCGEFVFQVGLPLKQNTAPTHDVLLGPGGKPVVKLFIYAARDDYDFITQDKETNKTLHFSALDLLNTPSQNVPETHRLPKFYVACLEAGGRPFLAPPNVPHLVMTMQDCVMVEERKISKLFLDEVAYFSERASRWKEGPIMYPFVTEDMQNEQLVSDNVIRPLLSALNRELTGRRYTSGLETDQWKHVVRTRAAVSLQTLLDSSPQWFALSANDELLIAEALARNAVDTSADARAIQQPRLQMVMRTLKPGISSLRTGEYAAYVHVGGKSRWGPARDSAELATADRKRLVAARKAKTLDELDW
ncbi:hypothetical protein SARC_10202 [Sphaeroforma arctica JP610]|uniref:JmjC domain-containing protein n=1 Tax=Sphaeroforma arctica JP610 TaxID=667725 RepID=A0A0L0FKN7_9EUKA|nr:hypothetical protein SARC_10202 [Sphaeroforma arctica JP610]KNC77335.1 hypothetical protein SARC_10202 [Sphaeroforma arctica JP610]|eukprot:XP_014151237.1 hypothetical protein SARC_10202 [Sphaeroforma arctica JP610]